MAGNAVARREPPSDRSAIVSPAHALADHPVVLQIQDNREQLEALLPEGVTLRRVLSSLWIASQKSPDILRAEPVSVVAAVATIAQWGLELGHTACILTFKDKNRGGALIATPCAQYNGLIELVVGSGAARAMHARSVFEGEPFRYRETAHGPELEHHPTAAGAPGALVGAYCVARITGSISQVKWMTVEQVDAIRLRLSRQWKDGACPPWYAEKTAVRQLVKHLPKNPRLAKVLRVIDQEEQMIEGVDAGEMPALPGAGSAEPALPAPRAPTPEQLERLHDLIADERIEQSRRDRVEQAMRSGALTEGQAATWIAVYEARYGAPAAPSPTREPGEEPAYQDDSHLAGDELPLGAPAPKARNAIREGH